jgi:hypothetical protein
MTPQNPSANGHASQTIDVASQALVFRPVHLQDATPTGAQLALAAGFKPNESAMVLQLLQNGTEEIRQEEVADLDSGRQFIIDRSDRLFRTTINGVTFDWLMSAITVSQVRVLGRIPANEEVLLQRVDHPDRPLRDDESVELTGAGVEAFTSRKPHWALNVQGVVRDYAAPMVLVRDALVNAGFDPNANWIITFKVKGQPKRQITVSDRVDLRTPGIEKIRLMPHDVGNGEGVTPPVRRFALLPVDIAHLEHLGLVWETVLEGDQRWLLIHNYPLPAGYAPAKVVLGLAIPKTYPAAQIDMFYVFPEALLVTGRAIPSTQVRATIQGRQYIGWSRHRQGISVWNPLTDSVVTHLALVEGALAKEIGE